ncbi:hypothetical protein F4779DRAFT_595088 [Xylariaceae sp. FL0662B]|nr:hypothetical protein F4779DRAFT_595088 [Xylariaceae sp. FL0662B]
MQPRIRSSSAREDPVPTNQPNIRFPPELHKDGQHIDLETCANRDSAANTYVTPDTDTNGSSGYFSFLQSTSRMSYETFTECTAALEARLEREAPCFSPFPHFPPELRRAVWALAVPHRVLQVRGLDSYIRFANASPAVKIPELSQACHESREILREKGTSLRFMDTQMNLIHEHWFDRRSDLFYIPSLYIFRSWEGWGNLLVGATVVANVLELVEDKYRLPTVSDTFSTMLEEGRFDGVDTFLLSLMTIENGEDLDIYQDGTTAVVDLDDKRLPEYLKPVFDNLRTLYPGKLTHSRPAKLLKHLRNEWNRDLKKLFEEQWLQGRRWRRIDDDEPCRRIITDRRFGHQNRRREVNRSSRAVAEALRRMPKIRPVLVFEKRWPSCSVDGNRYRHASAWHAGRRADGLEAISNRRRMALTTEIVAGRETLYAW